MGARVLGAGDGSARVNAEQDEERDETASDWEVENIENWNGMVIMYRYK